MKRPIIDKAEISVEFPNKSYFGSFGRHSVFDVAADDHGVHINFAHRQGEKRRVGCHIQYYLLADILASIGAGLGGLKTLDASHAEALQRGAKAIDKALIKLAAKPKKQPRGKDGPVYRVR